MGRQNKDCSILGSIRWSPVLGKLAYDIWAFQKDCGGASQGESIGLCYNRILRSTSACIKLLDLRWILAKQESVAACCLLG